MSNTWWQEYYDDIDNQRLDSLGSRTAQNVVVRTAGFPAVEGLENVLNGQREFFSTFKSLRHDFTNTWEVEDTAVLEAIVTYTRHDETSVEVPCVSILHRTDELVDSVRIYLDLAPIYA